MILGNAQALVLHSQVAPRVQVPNNHILSPNLYYNCYYQNHKYLIVRYRDI